MTNNKDRFRRDHERFGLEYHFKQGPCGVALAFAPQSSRSIILTGKNLKG